MTTDMPTRADDSPPLATAADEQPIFLPMGDETLFAIVTHPSTAPRGAALLIFSGGAWCTSLGRNRTFTRLARRAAAHGYHALRIDYQGVGESSGSPREFKLDKPFSGDVVVAVEALRAQGVERFYLFGTCFGARVVAEAALLIDGVSGLVLSAAPVRDFELNQRLESLPVRELARRALGGKLLAAVRDGNARRRYVRLVKHKLASAVGRSARRGDGGPRTQFAWVSPRFIGPLRAVIERSMPVQLIYGDGDDYYDDFKRGGSGELGALIDQAGDQVTLTVVPGVSHSLPSITVQQQIIDTTVSWLDEIDGPAPPP